MWVLLLGLLMFVGLMSISWILTCGLIWIISLCFKFTFSWAIATGIWLVMCLFNFGVKVTFKKD